MVVNNNKITSFISPVGTVAPGYDDTELRELIAENLIIAENYTDESIENYEEKDPTMVSISNIEINHIFS